MDSSENRSPGLEKEVSKGYGSYWTTSQTLSGGPHMTSGMPPLWIPNCPMGTPSTVCLSHTFSYPMVSSLCILMMMVRARLERWLVIMCRKPAWICRPERDHRLEIYHFPWESKKEPVNAQPGELWDGEKGYKCKNLATRKSKECGTGLSIEGLIKPQNP